MHEVCGKSPTMLDQNWVEELHVSFRFVSVELSIHSSYSLLIILSLRERTQMGFVNCWKPTTDGKCSFFVNLSTPKVFLCIWNPKAFLYIWKTWSLIIYLHHSANIHCWKMVCAIFSMHIFLNYFLEENFSFSHAKVVLIVVPWNDKFSSFIFLKYGLSMSILTLGTVQ